MYIRIRVFHSLLPDFRLRHALLLLQRYDMETPKCKF